MGLSRVRRLKDMFILNLNEQKITDSMNVVNETCGLRENLRMRICVPNLQKLSQILESFTTTQDLCICILKTWFMSIT